MKFKIEPGRMKQLFINSMIYKGAKPSYDPGVFVFDGTKVRTTGIYMGNYGIYSEHKKEFFLEYECEEQEIIPITDVINTRLGWGFDTAEVTVETKGNKIIFDGKKDNYETELENHDPPKLPWKFVMNEDIGGFVPLFNFKHSPEWDKEIEIKSLFDIEKDELKLPPANEYEFIFSDDGLTIRIPDGGTFSRKLEGEVISDESIKVKVDATYFSTIVENLSGKVRLAFTEDMVLFIESVKDHDTTYFLGTQVE